MSINYDYTNFFCFLQILPWIGQIMPCGGQQKTYGWTRLDGLWTNTTLQPMP